MAVCKKIIIAGFSGAGKTTLLRAMQASAPADWEQFDDLDELILKHHGDASIPLAQLISEVGWQRFRLWERQLLEQWLKNPEKGVLSLGGGALSALILELFGRHPSLQFIHLHIPFEEAWKRLTLPRATLRPLVQLGQAHLESLYQERIALFNQLKVQLNGLESPEKNALKLWKLAL
jgi:shikimate kinase